VAPKGNDFKGYFGFILFPNANYCQIILYAVAIGSCLQPMDLWITGSGQISFLLKQFIVGLGNTGTEYELTRNDIGSPCCFVFIHILMHSINYPLVSASRYSGLHVQMAINLLSV
jgi:hypothetical protein